jgi:DNA-binding response OmpR family regulator
MTGPAYASANALIYDPDMAGRAATRGCLEGIGFRDVQLAATLENLAARLKAAPADLLLCEVSGGEAKACAFIQDIRQDRRGSNPFMVIMATSWRHDSVVVSQVLNSGADDLVCRPFTDVMLAERIRQQIERRKAFVVTADYIGPDRRRDPRRSGPECITVPNALKTKALACAEAMRLESQIGEARAAISQQKMRRNAIQLCVQYRLLEQRRPGGHDFAEVLGRMRDLTEDLCRRAAGSQRSALECCHAMRDSLAAIERMIETSKHEAEDMLLDLGPPMQLLGHAALSLGRILAPGELEGNRLVELEAMANRVTPGVLRAQDDATITFRAAS